MVDQVIPHHHDMWLVVLSIVIAVLASYTSLDLAGRMRVSPGIWWVAWLPAAALAMGGGIWSMHFVAMLAFHFGGPVSYDVTLTALSLLLAIVVTGIGLFTVHRRRGDRIGIVAGGTLMGIGIVSMHYTGMAAMRMQATIEYHPLPVVLSVVIAIGAASAALWLSAQPQRMWQQALSAVVMGGAIAGMHFTGMAAVTLQASPDLPASQGLGLSQPALAGAVAAATLFVLGLEFTVAFVDRRLSRAQLETELLQRSERRFRALVQNASDVIGIIDRAGRIAYEISPVDRIPGYRPETLADKPFLELVGAADRERAAKLLETVRGNPGATKKTELILSIADGSTRHFEVSLTNLSAEPTIAGVVANLRDITERRRAEERYREVVDLIQAGVWIHEDGKIVFANPYAVRMFGGKSPDDVVGRETMSLLHPDDLPRARQRTRMIMDGAASVPLAELRMVRLDGRTITAEVLAIALRHETTLNILAPGRDVTAQREAEAQRHQAQKMEVVGQLTGGVAHDFNNLLTVVIGNLDLATERVDGAMRPVLESALQAAERGAALVHQLLAFSRRQALNPQEIEVNGLVSGAEELLRRTLGDDIEIEMNLRPGLWPAFADKSQVENALLNLAINARDAMPTGGKLTIETANVHLDEDYAARNLEVTAGDYVLLAVSDTGVGMSPEVVERAFEPFFTTKETGKGTGLGLSMIYGFAKQSRGHVKIYSEVDHGTTVRVYLPRLVHEAARGASGAAASPHIPSGGETVLLVEDDPDVRGFVASLLHDLGYVVLTAADGPAAWKILDTEMPIDLLFTDVVMPGGITGRKLAEEAKLRRPGLRTLFTSGYTENSIVHQGRLDPGVHLLSKPYKRQDLALKLREVLESPP
jgi:PAS domain S-box-containing protein